MILDLIGMDAPTVITIVISNLRVFVSTPPHTDCREPRTDYMR